MELLETARRRHSVRRFTPEPLSENQRDQLWEMAALAFSGGSRRPLTLQLREEPGILHDLAQAKGKGGLSLKSAPAVFVISADPHLSDTWIEDGSIAAAMILMEAEALGLGGCWNQIRGRSNELGDCETQVKRICSLPCSCRVLCLLAIGHEAESPASVIKG